MVTLCPPDPEMIEWFIEDQAFLRSYDSTPRTPPPPTSPVSKSSLFLSLPVCRRSSLLTGKGAGVEPNHRTARKLGPLYIFQSSLPLSFTYLEGDKGLGKGLVLFFHFNLTRPPALLLQGCCRERRRIIYCLKHFFHCWISVTFWRGSGSAEPYLWLMDPDPDPTTYPTPFFSDFIFFL